MAPRRHACSGRQIWRVLRWCPDLAAQRGFRPAQLRRSSTWDSWLLWMGRRTSGGRDPEHLRLRQVIASYMAGTPPVSRPSGAQLHAALLKECPEGLERFWLRFDPIQRQHSRAAQHPVLRGVAALRHGAGRASQRGAHPPALRLAQPVLRSPGPGGVGARNGFGTRTTGRRADLLARGQDGPHLPARGGGV